MSNLHCLRKSYLNHFKQKSCLALCKVNIYTITSANKIIFSGGSRISLTITYLWRIHTSYVYYFIACKSSQNTRKRLLDTMFFASTSDVMLRYTVLFTFTSETSFP